ncbi:hypothetical protein G9A89_014081 [Geosiphon pyriformis]|nr:hypothetical protein G9A89_014081 [Geosiphon pyriformis]
MSVPLKLKRGGVGRISKADDLRAMHHKVIPSSSSIVIENNINSPPKQTDAPATSEKSRFQNREKAGVIAQTWNSHIPSQQSPLIGVKNKRCEVVLLKGQQDLPYRYMYEKLIDRYEAIDDRIEQFVAIFKDEFEELFDPSCSSQELIRTIGKISCDSDGKLNLQSLMLDSPQSIGEGRRVKLSLDDQLSSFVLFPGQVVAIAGINSTGQNFIVRQFYEIPLLPMAFSSPREIKEYNYGARMLDGKEMVVIAAAGPFTMDDNLDFEPFCELVKQLSLVKPDAVILMGPFVDENHQLIRSGNLDITPEEIFSRKISDPLEDFLRSSPSTNIILIPSLQDIIHSHMAFPQPPLQSTSGFRIPLDFKSLPNPAQFRLNEIVFGATTNDIISHLNLEVCFCGIKERIVNLCRQILNQRSFYPLFPPHSGANLSLTNLSSIQLQILPDIIIVPSRTLQYFVQNVENVLFINPGTLAKGTFARLTIHPINEEHTQTDQVIHRVAERSRIEIIRI